MRIKTGDQGPQIKTIQEWLNYWGFSVIIDGTYGAATAAAVKAFQTQRMFPSITGEVDDATFSKLESPLTSIKTVPELKGTLGAAIIQVCQHHLAVHPREIGGQNMGPFVRHYMRGHEGEMWPWCAGFVSTIILQAYAALKISPARFAYRVGCDSLYRDAQKAGTLSDHPTYGGIFLVYNPANPSDCVHTGIILDLMPDGIMKTGEGNTNETGSREGFEGCMRYRQATNKYFINLS